MKKIDRFILGAFVGPFFLTLAIVVFILLIQQMMQYIDELLGKGLGYDVFAELLFYFALHLVPLALPLAVLLSSLITFGNLGEHYELTAMKSSGISLIRVLFPIFIFSVLIAFGSFWFNDQIVPQANLKAYSLLWDIRQKSPSLSLKEGAFYNGLPGYSIKVNKKFSDGKTIKDIMIYDHKDARGNRVVILADSGKMYTIMNERYLVLELFKGRSYHDQVSGANTNDFSNEKFVLNTYNKSQIVFSLASFDMKDTDESLFKGHRVMHTTWELMHDVDSLHKQMQKMNTLSMDSYKQGYQYRFRRPQVQVKVTPPVRAVNNSKNPQNTDNQLITNKAKNPLLAEKLAKIQKNRNTKLPLKDSTPIKPIVPAAPTIKAELRMEQVMTTAVNQARNMLTVIKSRKEQVENLKKELNQFEIELYKKITFAFACITMFFIGAPLGAIIKKGGLGLPVLVSIIFFIIFYVISITGEKWVKESFLSPPVGMWMANVILMAFGLFFLRQARNDSRIFEADFYYVFQDRILQRFKKKATV